MEVILNVNNSCTFDELVAGDCFITVDTEDTKNIYMVVFDPLELDELVERENGLAVDVQSGKLFAFPTNTVVKPVGAKLTVTY